MIKDVLGILVLFACIVFVWNLVAAVFASGRRKRKIVLAVISLVIGVGFVAAFLVRDNFEAREAGFKDSSDRRLAEEAGFADRPDAWRLARGEQTQEQKEKSGKVEPQVLEVAREQNSITGPAAIAEANRCRNEPACWEKLTAVPDAQMRRLWSELQGMRFNKEFHEYGFGKGGSFWRWKDELQDLMDNKIYSASLLIRCDMVPGDLYTLAMDYMKKDITEGTEFIEQEWEHCLQQ